MVASVQQLRCANAAQVFAVFLLLAPIWEMEHIRHTNARIPLGRQMLPLCIHCLYNFYTTTYSDASLYVFNKIVR